MINTRYQVTITHLTVQDGYAEYSCERVDECAPCTLLHHTRPRHALHTYSSQSQAGYGYCAPTGHHYRLYAGQADWISKDCAQVYHTAHRAKHPGTGINAFRSGLRKGRIREQRQIRFYKPARADNQCCLETPFRTTQRPQ